MCAFKRVLCYCAVSALSICVWRIAHVRLLGSYVVYSYPANVATFAMVASYSLLFLLWLELGEYKKSRRKHHDKKSKD